MILFRRLKASVAYRIKDAFLRFMKLTAIWWPDELYIKTRYYIYFGRRLNLSNPQTFNEKIQWLKLNYCPDIYATMVDKYEAKRYVANIIGEQYIIPTLGVWDNADDVDFDMLPDKFVIKCNHNSGLGMYICKDKKKMDPERVRRDLYLGLKEKFYKMAHEMQYKSVKPLIIAEEFIEDDNPNGLIDYKFFCFNGEVKMCEVISNRWKGHLCANYYDLDWNILPIGSKKMPSDSSHKVEKPDNLSKMVEIASVLSKGYPHIRVDLYNVKGHIYFGELTLTHNGGFNPFVPIEWDYTIGSWLKLPQI